MKRGTFDKMLFVKATNWKYPHFLESSHFWKPPQLLTAITGFSHRNSSGAPHDF